MHRPDVPHTYRQLLQSARRGLGRRLRALLAEHGQPRQPDHRGEPEVEQQQNLQRAGAWAEAEAEAEEAGGRYSRSHSMRRPLGHHRCISARADGDDRKWTEEGRGGPRAGRA